MRVVGGRLKGRNLASPSSQAIRPTADRLRESVFNILIHAYDDPDRRRARARPVRRHRRARHRGGLARAAFTLFVDNGAEAARCCATMSRRWAWAA
jgi:16S rRNA (guanine966-N2)-methyltransferase